MKTSMRMLFLGLLLGALPALAAYNPTNPNGQTTMANSQPVVIASNQSAVPVSGTFWLATQPVSGTFWQATQPVSGTFWQATQPVSGPLTDTQLRATAVPVSLASVPSHAVTLASTTITGSVAVTGPVTDTQLRATPVPVSGTVSTGGLTDTQLRATAVPVSGTFWQTTQPISGTVTATGPLTDTQLRASAVPVSLASVPSHAVTLASTTITGSVAVTGTFWQATQPVSAASLPLPTGAATETTLAAVNTKLPTAAASADGLTNPTVTQVGAAGLLFNGTTWDRQRNNFNTATGDSGTKTASFNGATQTNYNARGAIITVQLGTVSGTSPTMAVQLQFALDAAGTNWANFGPASANATASSQQIMFLVYPTNTSQTAGATPTNFTSPGVTQIIALNAALPRLWRVVYSIGGTTPSFALTATYVNYTN